jgi:WD40 repeat protein
MYLAAVVAPFNIQLLDAQTYEHQGLLTGHSSRIQDLCFSYDGMWLLSASNDKTARIWDTVSKVEIKQFKHDLAVLKARSNNAKDRIATNGVDGFVRIWCLETDQTLAVLGCAGIRSSIWFSLDDSCVIYMTTFGKDIKQRNIASKLDDGVITCSNKFDRYSCFAVSPSGDSVVTGSERGVIAVHSFIDGQRRYSHEESENLQILSVCYSPVDSEVVAFSSVTLIAGLNISMDTVLWRISSRLPVHFLSWDPSGSRILYPIGNSQICVVDIASQTSVFQTTTQTAYEDEDEDDVDSNVYEVACFSQACLVLM